MTQGHKPKEEKDSRTLNGVFVIGAAKSSPCLTASPTSVDFNLFGLAT
jgi:hypothetical protein